MELPSIGDLSATYLTELSALVLVGITVWALKRARNVAANWRQILHKRALRKSDKDHKLLTRLLLIACAGTPQVFANVFAMFLLSFSAVVIAGMLIGGVAAAYSGRQKSLEYLSQLPAARVLADLAEGANPHLSEDAEELLSRSNPEKLKSRILKTEASSEKAATAYLILLIVESVGVCIMAPLSFYLFVKWLPQQTTAIYIRTWLDQCVTRLLAIAVKDEARQLAGLELNVKDEESLRLFIRALHDLSTKYGLGISSEFTWWLEENDRRALRASNP